MKNGWTSLQYNEENNAFVAIHKTGSLENEIISISLKVKENAKVGETTIKVKGFVASEGKEDINTDESETKINIVEKNNPTPPADENDNNNNSDKNNNNDNDGKMIIIFQETIIKMIILKTKQIIIKKKYYHQNYQKQE